MKKKLSKISTLHYVKLILRSLLFICVLICYILNKIDLLADFAPLMITVWIFFFVGMLLRFFPSKLESMGCQKQFARNFEAYDDDRKPINQSWKVTALVAVVWITLNAVIGGLYFSHLIDKGILILIAIGYSICDIICILFFCPFQTWFMKNRCCTTCRIYNWDYAMMFTPFVFIPSIFTYSLLGCAVALLVRWEVTYKRHPERFSTETNRCLDCSRCEEKLCSHKTQLQGFLKKHSARFFSPRKNDGKKE